jgi:hypothetical protein
MVDSRGAFKTTGAADQRNAGVRNWIKHVGHFFAVGAERGLVVDGALTLEQARVAAMAKMATASRYRKWIKDTRIVSVL